MKLRSLRLFALSTTVLAASSCTNLDTTRVAGPNATLGDDIYGVFCDRVGASVLAEDLSGASYNAICHYDAKGNYGSTVDLSALPPPVTAAEKTARTLAIAKLTRMAQRRGDLVHAINATFPDTSFPDITSTDPSKQIRFHDALFTFAQTVSQLYETNPVDPGGAPLLPGQTRSMARLFGALGAPGTCAGTAAACTWDSDCGAGTCQSPVRGALSHMWGRQGYRPFQVGLGAVRPALGYPDLRKLTTTTLSVLGPGGAAAPELQQVLAVMQQELVTAGATVSPLPTLTVQADIAQPSRPRQNIEFASALFLTQNAAFAGPGAVPNYIALRDRRGLVVPLGNTPGTNGTVKGPFVDLNGDGYADIDPSGRFVDASGTPLALDPPFAIPGQTTDSTDAYGRPASSVASYTYLDTSQTMVAGLTQSLIPLLDPTVIAPAGAPAPWMQEHETLMYALAGAYLLYGDRAPATYDYGTEGPRGQKVAYNSFNPAGSPIPDLIHAAGQVLADKDSDALLLSLLDLLQNHEQVVARLLGAALNIRQIAKMHDAAAAAGTEQLATLAYEVPIWDQMAKIIADILQHPGLLTNLLAALADDTSVTPFGGAQHMGDALSKFVSFRDALTYNKLGTNYDGSGPGVNGPAVNLTVDPMGNAIDVDPKTPVDRTMPQTGANMSDLQKSLMLIHDANGGPACNRNGAKVEAALLGLTVSWPLVGSYNECELFQFDNLADFYLDSMLPSAHEKRSYLNIKSGTLTGILDFLGAFGANPDDLFQQSSDIAGLTLHPEAFALNRLVFYGADSAAFGPLPDLDLVNQSGTTNNFVSNLIDPISCAWCPPDASNQVPTCTDSASTVRLRDANTIFLWERFGFTNYLGPMVKAFADVACDANEANCDLTNFQGEKIFADLIELLNLHWPAANHGPECSKTSTTSPCSEAGVNNYEPILTDSFAGDIVPALHEFAVVATELSKITVARGPAKGQVMTGAQLLEKMSTILFDPTYAASVGMVDRKGNASTTWVDGTPQPQLTVFTLVADALHKIDTRFAGACDCSALTGQAQATCMASFSACRADAVDRQGQWKQARSQLVDEFLAVDGTGTSAAFHNPTVTPTLIATLELAREQTNANCPDRESGTVCNWAKIDLGNKLAGVLGRPMFAALVDMTETLRQNDPARRQLETFLQYLLQAMTDNGQSLQGAMASMSDMLQVLADDGDLAPILDAASVGAAPDADPAGPGTGTLTIKVLKALTNDKYDQYHVMDHVLPNLVTPVGGTNLSPIEIFMDVIADVNRIDASTQGPMASDDYEAVMSTMQGFMIDKTRGLEQLYTIIQKRPTK